VTASLPASEPEWRSIAWLASHYDVSVTTVRTWLKRMPVELHAEAVRAYERVIRIDRRALDAWLKDRTKAAPEAGNASVSVLPGT